MPDLDDQLVVFGRWLDHEIASAAADRPPAERALGGQAPLALVGVTNRSSRGTAVARTRQRRHHLATLVLAGVVSAAAAVAILLVVGTDRRPDGPLGPGPTTVPTTSVAPPSSVSPAPSPPPVTVPGPAVTTGPTSASPTPPAEPSPSHPEVVAPAVVSSPVIPSSGGRPTPAPTTVAPSAPVETSTVGPTTTPSDPTVVPTTPPTVASTVPAGAPCSTGVKTARRNSVFYRVCGSAVSLTGAVPAAGWSQGQVLSAGPPVVSVRFDQPSTGATVTCTVSADGDGMVTASGDC